MGVLLGLGTADGQTVHFDVTAGLDAADCPPYGSALGVGRLLDSVDDAGEAGDGGGQRGAVDGAEAAGLDALPRAVTAAWLHPPHAGHRKGCGESQ
jgi:hypothetical protein